MEHIKKYKIEDESLDDQMDNYLYSQNSYSSNNPQKNVNIISNNSQPKTINVSQPKIQISELNSNINAKNNTINKTKNFNNSEQKEEILEQNIQNIENNLEEINLTNENDINNTDIDNAYHHVQIIDEDVENFKRRLDIMVKNFRTDTLKDFMAIKRNLLIEQKTCIENEKQKCEALLSSKGDLIEHLKDDLAKTQKALNNQIIIKEKFYLRKIMIK